MIVFSLDELRKHIPKLLSLEKYLGMLLIKQDTDGFKYFIQFCKFEVVANNNFILMQHSQGLNPEAYVDHSMTFSGHLRKNDRLSNKQTLFQECRAILQRPHQNRIPSDNQTLLQLVEKNELLKELTELYGLDFVKGVLRNAKLQFIEEGQVIAEEEQDIKYMVVLLQGKIGVQRSSFDPSAEQQSDSPQQTTLNAQQQQALQNTTLKTQALFDKLTLLAKKQREAQRRTMKLKRKGTLPISEYKFLLPVLTKHDFGEAQAKITRTILMNEQFGGKERLNGRFFKNRAIALQKSTIFIIEISFLFYWLEMAFKSKLNKNIERMKSIPAFEILQTQKLGEIIVSMKLVRRGKNSYVYTQGDPAEMIYLLVDGQLKVSKEADLFKENPNNLYTDRRKLIQQQKKSLSRSMKDPQQDLLPFANLTTLYNYRPTKKIIDMGLISSFGLFGEEQIIFKTKRQTTVQVSSIEASYYQIQFKKVLDIIGNKNPKNIEKFREALQASVSKKILYRQKQFAELVHFQNTKNLNYFYIDQGKKEKSPRRLKLDKINEKVEPKTARESNDVTPAYFTTFNFNKMFSKRYSTLDKKATIKSTNNQSSTENLPVVEVEYNRAEQKVVDISHTWDPIQRKVRQEGRLSKRLSPFKHQINIEQPLIDTQFFDNVAKEQRRINKQQRNIRFSLGKRNK